MLTQSTRARLFATTIICGATMAAAAPAFAQDAQPAAGAGGVSAVQEVVVTGSRIPQPNLTATSPLTVVNAQELKLEGTQRVEDLLNNLPQVFADQGSTLSNGATGTATVDLRGLGPKRTLVLVNGRRLEPGDPTDPVADLNNIPAALVQRVDIVTGGASSVYGADAVAGVVNFVMQSNFQGVRLDANFGLQEHDNHDDTAEALEAATAATRSGIPTPTGNFTGGFSTDVTAVMGMNAPDDRGNITVYAGYRNQESILESQYDYSACGFKERTAAAGGGFVCGGSGTNATGQFLPQNGPNGGTGDFTVDKTTGQFRPYTSADAFNFAPYNYYQRPDTRYTAGLFGHYAVTPKLELYTEFMFMDDHTLAQLAPSGLFGQTFVVPCSNPFLNASELAALCGGSTAGSSTVNILRRNVEGGGRVDDLRHTDYRLVIGARGDLNSAWHYDMYGQYGESLLTEEYLNDVSLTNVANALNVSGTAANPSCPANVTTGQSCVPLNIFAPGGVTKAALNYVDLPGFQNATIVEQIVSASLTGKLGEYGIKSPFADDGVGIALGTEYRRESLDFQTDAEFSSGDLAGQGGPKIGVSGSYDVYELFGEVRIPLINNRPFIKDISIDGGYRFSDYSSIGDTNTYSIEGNYSVDDNIRFRASYNHAVRAPNIVELFAPASVGTGAFSTDNCAGATPTFTAAQCANTGVTAAQYGHISANGANQYNGLSGGNPNLQPEVAETYSAGFVLTPRIIPGFTFSADYFNIYTSNVIFAGLDPQNTIDTCAQTGNPFYCSLVHRAPGTGSLYLGTLGYVSATNLNAGSLQTSGLDIESTYRMRIPDFMSLHNLGRLSFNFTGTYLGSLVTEEIPGSAQKYDCAGAYGPNCGTPNPKWRSKFRITWTTPWNLELSGQWRYIDSVKVDSQKAFFLGTVYPADAELGDRSYFDLTASYKVRDGYTLRVGVNNVLDQDPPLIGSSKIPATVGNGNTFPQVYDSLGRYLFAGITADF